MKQNKTASIEVVLTPERKAQIMDYAKNRDTSISKLVRDYFDTLLTSDNENCSTIKMTEQIKALLPSQAIVTYQFLLEKYQKIINVCTFVGYILNPAELEEYLYTQGNYEKIDVNENLIYLANYLLIKYETIQNGDKTLYKITAIDGLR